MLSRPTGLYTGYFQQDIQCRINLQISCEVNGFLVTSNRKCLIDCKGQQISCQWFKRSVCFRNG